MGTERFALEKLDSVVNFLADGPIGTPLERDAEVRVTIALSEPDSEEMKCEARFHLTEVSRVGAVRENLSVYEIRARKVM